VRTLIKLTMIALIAIASTTHADDLVVHVASKHFTNSDTEFEELNPGLGYRYDFTENTRLIAGFYRNSMGVITYYAGADVHTDVNTRFGIIEFGAEFGAATGYNTPIIATPYIEYKHIKVNFFPVWEQDGITGGALGLSITHNLFGG